MRALLIAFSLAIAPLWHCHAQEQFGLAHSNYAGLDAGALNPARFAGQWPYADIRLAGVDLFAWNSLVAYGDREQRLPQELRGGFSGATGDAVFRRSIRGHHRAFVDAGILGPGASLALGRGTVYAGVQARAGVTAVGVTNELGNFIHHGFGYRPQHGVRYTDGAARAIGMAWTEFSAGYARILRAEGFGMLSGGVTVKYGLGHAAGAFSSEGLDYTVVDTMRMEIHSATAAYGYAMPAFRAGAGFGADAGIVYERTEDEADGYMPHRSSGGCSPMRYRYRIGASLIDIGGLRFRDAVSGSLSTGAISIADYTALSIDGPEGVDSLLSSGINWERRQGLAVGLPTAASIQVDYAIADRAYVAMSLVQQVSGARGMRLRRPNSMAFAPRFETRYFEAALPIVINEYDFARPSVGFMLRFDGIVIGTDRIMPFVGRRDIHAMDLYLRVRWMIFRSPFCRGKRGASGAHRVGSREMIPCEIPRD